MTNLLVVKKSVVYRSNICTWSKWMAGTPHPPHPCSRSPGKSDGTRTGALVANLAACLKKKTLCTPLSKTNQDTLGRVYKLPFQGEHIKFELRLQCFQSERKSGSMKWKSIEYREWAGQGWCAERKCLNRRFGVHSAWVTPLGEISVRKQGIRDLDR